MLICMQVIWKYFLSTESSGDYGTLYQLRNRLGRTNVVRYPDKNFNACDDFFSSVITGHVLTALKQLTLEEFDTEEMWLKTKEERKEMLLSIASQVVDKYVDFSYHGPHTEEPSQPSSDKVNKYATQLLSLGLFYMEYSDAIRESDGNRIKRCNKYLLPIFWNSQRTNYSGEMFNMLYQYSYSMSPRHAAQLLWSRGVNLHGRRGKNIPMDLHLEHLNRVVKESIKGLGSNKTEKAITRVGKALGTIYPVLNRFDSDNKVPDISSNHKPPNTGKDIAIIVEELSQAKVFNKISSRKHKQIPNPRNVLHGMEKKLLEDWMINKLKKIYKN